MKLFLKIPIYTDDKWSTDTLDHEEEVEIPHLPFLPRTDEAFTFNKMMYDVVQIHYDLDNDKTIIHLGGGEPIEESE